MTPPRGKGGPAKSGGGPAKSGAGRAKRGRTGRKGRSRARKPQQAARAFWGEPPTGDDGLEPVDLAHDPGAVIRSLGPPPLGDRETIGEHYFDAVSGKAVTLAGALAAASGLQDFGEPDAASDDDVLDGTGDGPVNGSGEITADPGAGPTPSA